MAVATTLRQYLADQEVAYEVTTHQSTITSSMTAESSHVSGDCVAKAVIVKDEDRFVMAVLPASHHVKLGDLSSVLGRTVHLATEDEASKLFPDCSFGAIPALGPAYGVDMVVDDSLAKQPEVYLEGGDHTSLVQVSAEQFFWLTQKAAHGHFSTHD